MDLIILFLQSLLRMLPSGWIASRPELVRRLAPAYAVRRPPLRRQGSARNSSLWETDGWGLPPRLGSSSQFQGGPPGD